MELLPKLICGSRSILEGPRSPRQGIETCGPRNAADDGMPGLPVENIARGAEAGAA
jgi:hypothetical protein